MRISTPRWPGTSADAAPTCGSAKPSRKPPAPDPGDSVVTETLIDRRDFLRTGAAAGVVLLGFRLPLAEAKPAAPGAGEFAPNAFIRVSPQGRITLIMPQV